MITKTNALNPANILSSSNGSGHGVRDSSSGGGSNALLRSSTSMQRGSMRIANSNS